MNLRTIWMLNSWPLRIAPATADRLAAERLRKKWHRANKTTEECAARLQSYSIYQSAQGAAIKLAQL